MATDARAESGEARGAAWPFAVAGVWAACLLLLFLDTTASMVRLWAATETFNHGFLILPIALWLAWRDRHALRLLPARPTPAPLPLLLLAGAGWLLASLVDVQVVRQLALVAMLVLGCWAILGHRIARRLAFPLGFLFLAVPMGLGLEPPMMDLTADWTVKLVRASGVPVYQEGLFFHLPTGNWSVVEACSGVRYIIASFTLGLIYAYLTYRSPWRRGLFILASLLVPVVANVLRAWGIVMLGHLSDMRLATGVDHLIYGWIFFGVVMLLLFWVGGFWQEETQGPEAGPMPAEATGTRAPGGRFFWVALAALALALLPQLAVTVSQDRGDLAGRPVALPAPVAGWAEVPAFTDWRPPRRGADEVLVSAYRGEGPVLLVAKRYLDQAQDRAELVAYVQSWFKRGGDWPRPSVQRYRVDLPGLAVAVEEARLQQRGSSETLLGWSWYLIDGVATVNPYLAKLLEARQLLGQRGRGGVELFLVTPLDGDAEAARERLKAFLQAQWPALSGAFAAGAPGRS